MDTGRGLTAAIKNQRRNRDTEEEECGHDVRNGRPHALLCASVLIRSVDASLEDGNGEGEQGREGALHDPHDLDALCGASCLGVHIRLCVCLHLCCGLDRGRLGLRGHGSQ